MGILGLRKFIDTSACQKYVQNLLFGEDDSNEAVNEEKTVNNNNNNNNNNNSKVSTIPSGNDALRNEIMKHYAGAGLLKQVQQHLSQPSPSSSSSSSSSTQQQQQSSNLSIKTPPPSSSKKKKQKSLIEVPEVDHICVDMNSIIHSALSAVQRGEGVVGSVNGLTGGGGTRHHLEEDVIATVIARVKELVTGTVRAKKSISLCIDGPAPLAKLHTQRLRRRRLRFVDIREKGELTSLDITAGSDFLVRLENRIALEFQMNDGCGFLLPPTEQLHLYYRQQQQRRGMNHGRGGGRGAGGRGAGGRGRSNNHNSINSGNDSTSGSRYSHFYCPVYLYGSCCIGEGEAKISRALAFIATRSEHLVNAFATPTPNSARYGGGLKAATQKRGGGGGNGGDSNVQRMGRNPRVSFERSGGHFKYNPQDSVVIIGNDIDLVLTALATTQYHNIYVLSPATLQVTAVGDIISRWLLQLSVGSGIFLHEARQLASARIDFVFLFLLNGGDHYVGLGEVAASLWARYRTVRARYGKATLVSRTLLNVSVEFLSDVVQADTYTGEADAGVGEALIRASLWSLHTLVTGRCPNYRFLPGEDENADPVEDGGIAFNKLSAPNINHVRAALAKAKQDHRPSMSTLMREEINPLTPLETYVALMPTEAMWPENIQRALLEHDTITNKNTQAAEDTTTTTTSTTTTTKKKKTTDTMTPSDKKKLALATAKCLLESNDASAIAIAAEDAVELAAPLLTPGEKLRCEFAPPVWINSPEVPPKPLSRYERHRMEFLQQQHNPSGGGSGGNSQQPFRAPRVPPTKVEVIGDALPFGYVYMEYPPDCDELIFVDPFASQKDKDAKAKGEGTTTTKEGTTNEEEEDGSLFVVRRFQLRDRVRRYSANDTHADQEQPFWMKTPTYVERQTKKRLREGDTLDNDELRGNTSNTSNATTIITAGGGSTTSKNSPSVKNGNNNNKNTDLSSGAKKAAKLTPKEKKKLAAANASSSSASSNNNNKQKQQKQREDRDRDGEGDGLELEGGSNYHKSTITEADMRDLDAGFVAELEAFLQSGPKKVSLKAITSTEDSEVAKKLLQRAEKRERAKSKKQELEQVRLKFKEKKKEKLRNKKKRRYEQRLQQEKEQGEGESEGEKKKKNNNKK